MASRRSPEHGESTTFRGPARTCIGCRQRVTMSELLRVVSGVDDQGRLVVIPDPGHRAHGRGAHLHPTVACFELAVRRKAFSRALRAPGSVTLDVVHQFVADSLSPGTTPVHNRPETGAGSS